MYVFDMLQQEEKNTLYSKIFLSQIQKHIKYLKTVELFLVAAFKKADNCTPFLHFSTTSKWKFEFDQNTFFVNQ